MRVIVKTLIALAAGLGATLLAACSSSGTTGQQLPPASFVGNDVEVGDKYIIGALDELTVFVWRNPELGAKVQVRPDGRITTPLITDMPAVGKTPAQLADDIKQVLVQ